jgi:tetratricopeptide (TPR) repeat protein
MSDKMVDTFLKAYYLNAQAEHAEKCPASQELLAYSEDAMDDERQTRVLDHLAFCPLCQEAVLALETSTQLREDLVSVDVAAAWQKFGHRPQGVAEKSGAFSLGLRQLWSMFMRPRVLATAALLVLMIVLPVLYVNRQHAANPALITETELAMEINRQLRGAENSPLDAGLDAFQKGDLPRARAQLLSAIKGDPNGYDAHYYLGLVYLVEAERSFLGRVAADSVNQSVRYLNRAAELASNPSFLADCYFYLAKAHLLRGDVAGARNYLQNLITLTGSGEPLQRRKRQATELMRRM